jgi:type III restriction enzyme
MRDTIIENPIINSPYEEPKRHFRFTEEGITNEIVDERRVSSYFVPIPRPKKKSQQLSFDTLWTEDRIEENRFINRVRSRVSMWRQGGYPGVTRTTARLLRHWNNPDREQKLFFCQIEALETLIYLTETAKKFNDAWIENDLRRFNEEANPDLLRIAFKMATGSGKTVVMAMIIAWHVLNRLSDPRSGRYSDTFLAITPGITIRDRLRVLLPNDPDNYYRKWDIVPPEWGQQLHKAKIIITNFHAFKLRELNDASKRTKGILAQNRESPFTESPSQMVRRACRELGNKKNIIVINDEAHHCYKHKVEGEIEELTGDERQEASKREEAARVWISGLEAVKKKIGIKVVYDLSATPFFLRGSGYKEGTLFPWVVSDFSLIDAIECGVVKVPRVPVADDSIEGKLPTYRHLWPFVREHLPKKGRRTEAVSGEPKLPKELEGALHTLYSNYEKYYEKWSRGAEAGEKGLTPPVFIVVCNNTNVSKMVSDYISGWEKELDHETTALVPGKLPVFSNVETGRWIARPNTILIDSEQLESGEVMSKEFKKIAAQEIENFKAEYRARFPHRDTEKLTDEDLLREVMNTVGKTGKLGEHIKCVVSVSMLTEGWDATTVTHILGIRAFGTQLLCEQVVGRALRRMNYALSEEGRFEPEYAEVFGVPFSFIPCAGSSPEPKPPRTPTRVRALEERIPLEITFPRLIGYRYEHPSDRLTANFIDDTKLALSTADVPTKVESAPIVGEIVIHTLEELRRKRLGEVAFLLAKLTLEKYFCDRDGNVKQWLFPQVLNITKRWLKECLNLKDNVFPQLLLFLELAHDAANCIYRAIITSKEGEKTLFPILRPYDTTGSTRYVDFDTTLDVYPTSPDSCHVSHVVLHSHWEAALAQKFEEMKAVVSYVKNHNLGFSIPYTLNGEEKQYLPDFIVKINDGRGEEDLLNLIIEVTGEKRKDKIAKVSTARNLWAPSINNHGSFGRWAFLEITDPWDAKNLIRSAIRCPTTED